jgi:hypothetical protein
VEGFGKRVAKIGAPPLGWPSLAWPPASPPGVKAFLKFEKGMNEVMTLLPVRARRPSGTVRPGQGLLQGVRRPARQGHPALYSALSAGVPKDNVFEFMEVAQKAAKGGVTDLETAVDGISSVINAYGAEVISATEASDLMFTAVRLGKTTFEEISGSIFQMAPIAAAVGIPFKDLTASIANLTARAYPHRRGRHPDEGRHGRVGQGGHQGRRGLPGVRRHGPPASSWRRRGTSRKPSWAP